MNAVDDGLLTSANKLPVIKLHYGGSLNRMSRIIYRLDPLICSGKSSHYPSEDAEVKFKSLEEKNILLQQKLTSMEEKFNSFANETDEAITATDGLIQDLSSETENNLSRFKSEQENLFNHTVASLSSKISLANRRVAFRWSGLESRTGDPSNYF